MKTFPGRDDYSLKSGRLAPFAVNLGALALLLLTLWARWQPVTNPFFLVLAVGAPYISGGIALVIVGVIAVTRRGLWLSALTFCTVVGSLAVQVSWYFLPQSSDTGKYSEMRLLVCNLRYGDADPEFFFSLARQSADIVAVSELTPAAVERFASIGIDSDFPYAVLAPEPGASGVGIYSRYPLGAFPSVRPRDYTIAAATVDLPGVAQHPVVSSLHLISPVADNTNAIAQWRRAISGSQAVLNAFAVNVGGGAVVVAGDFNSTPDMRQFRDLLSNGYQDAVQQTGSGFAPTFPSRTWHPPLLTIDHILTRNAAASSVETVYIPGSDHRALLGTIRIPVAPQHP